MNGGFHTLLNADKIMHTTIVAPFNYLKNEVAGHPPHAWQICTLRMLAVTQERLAVFINCMLKAVDNLKVKEANCKFKSSQIV